jgi:hypothetical protein
MTGFRIVLALAATLALAACYPPTTSHPVGTTAGLGSDPVLTGLWKGTDSDGKAHYAHFLHQSDGTLTILLVEAGPKAEDAINITATTAKLGANRLMNAKLVWTNNKPEEEPRGTVPVLYTLGAKGELTIALMDEHKVKDAVRAGRLKGTIEKGDMGDVIITADPAALDTFMASPGAVALFAAPAFTLHRME